MLNSYPSIYALGHRAIADILHGSLVIEEKIDGSQFSMGRDFTGNLFCRSKGKEIVIDAPEKMFAKAVETAASLPLACGYTYRCEYLQSPKHNTLAYSRVPRRHLIVFDICTGLETYLSPTQKRIECNRIGLEYVPCFYDGAAEQFSGNVQTWMDCESVLGGVKIEGVVIKNYGLFTPDKKIAIAKVVSEAFKEKHQSEWRKSNPTQSDVVQFLIAQLRTEARWKKAVQHLREAGQLVRAPQDIGPLIKELQADTEREEGEDVRDALFKHFWPQISRGLVHGFPEFYKQTFCGVEQPG